jgi:hypothetical protein
MCCEGQRVDVMDGWLILLRVVHIGSLMAWFGGAVVAFFFLLPTADTLGRAGQPFMDHLMNRLRLGTFVPIVVARLSSAERCSTVMTWLSSSRPGSRRRPGWPSRLSGL